MTRSCAYCGQPFTLRPQVPDQAYCSLPTCQRARKRRWQKIKLQSDPDYRANQRAAQQTWSKRHPNYWQNYRTARPRYEQRRHEPPPTSDQGRHGDCVKMDVCSPPNGLYRITLHPAFPATAGDSWVVEMTRIYVTCPCKMDRSREDVIDT